MKKDYAVIFKRTGFVEGKGCSLEPIGYVEGKETDIKGVKYFIINPSYRTHCLEDIVPNENLEEFLRNNKRAKFMGDRSNFSLKYVYGVPFDTTIMKDLLVYNFSFLEGVFPQVSKQAMEESYDNSVEQLKEKYVEALKEYDFYQTINSEGKVETFCQRRQSKIYRADVENVIPQMFTEELGFDIPENYSFDTDYSKVYKQIPKEIDVKKISEEVKKYIKGQDKHIVPILNAINDNLSAEIPEERVNVLVCGPTGCGKTAVIERIANMVGLPIVIEDSTQFSKVGYEGRNVSDAVEDLIEAANGDKELAQYGILVFDEFDKKASNTKDDVSGQTVITSMLKLLEGRDYSYEVGNGLTKQTKTFNTLNTTIVLAGAFSGLADTVSLKSPPGFGREEVNKTNEVVYDADNLSEYGIPKECAGRVDLEIFDKLSVESLKDILLNGKVNPLALFVNKMKKRYNTNVIVSDEFVNALAQKAYDSGLGARSLYKEFRTATKIAVADISLMNSSIPKELLLTPEMIYDNTQYQLNVAKVKTLRR